jgi:hypothetical protein
MKKIAFLLAVLALACAAHAADTSAPPRPNILLIIADELGYLATSPAWWASGTSVTPGM